MKNLDRKVNETNQLVRNQMRQREIVNTEDNEDRDKRTRIVRKPCDVDIRNSKDLRKNFNKYYPLIMLRHARITVGGSYLLEFDEESAATEVQENWKNDYFGGNSGIVKFNDQNCTGIVKYVYDAITENEIGEEIEKNYPGAKYELFKNNDEFTGMIKVIFPNEDALNRAINNRFEISHRKYLIEVFKHKPRVIKCNICQDLGHVSRLCRKKDKPICGKCSKEGHKTKDCTTDEAEHKCYHCKKSGHITGSYSCEVMKAKLQELMSRIQND